MEYLKKDSVMKELSIEQKAKAYDEALDRARKLLKDMEKDEYFASMEDIKIIFPELKESEDDRIRKDIVAAVETYGDFTQRRKEEIYAWLEKQDSKILANFAKTCKDVQKPA